MCKYYRNVFISCGGLITVVKGNHKKLQKVNKNEDVFILINTKWDKV